MKTILTFKESQHLKEIGVDPKMAHVCADDVPENEKPEWGDPNMIDILESQCVFSLEDLLRILPKKITDRRNIYELRMGVCDCLCGDEQWFVEYKDSRTDIDELESFQSAEELIDAIYQEICFLKTEKIKEL